MYPKVVWCVMSGGGSDVGLVEICQTKKLAKQLVDTGNAEGYRWFVEKREILQEHSSVAKKI